MTIIPPMTPPIMAPVFTVAVVPEMNNNKNKPSIQSLKFSYAYTSDTYLITMLVKILGLHSHYCKLCDLTSTDYSLQFL